MLRITSTLLFCLTCLYVPSALSASKPYDFFAFCYHDVRNDVLGVTSEDSGALNTQHLAEHFQWLKDNGYAVVSLEQIQQAKRGEIELPKKSVYLSFDDGYRSFYTKIYPLLKAYQYPATFGLVTDWIENDEHIEFGTETAGPEKFLTWDQIREMQESGLIEMASHTHNMHKGVIGNPQGNTQPAATTLQYLSETYETTEQYTERLTKDFKDSYAAILMNTGVAPKTLIWPYGSYSEEAWEIAKSVGFEHSLILEEGENQLAEKTEHINRFLIDKNPSVSEFADSLKISTYIPPVRVVHVDIDYLYDESEEQFNRNLSVLIERIKQMGITTVYLQAFADPDGDGNASALYFPNKEMPMRADLFNRVAWQLETRSEVDVYAWMPVSAFDFGERFYNEHGVKTLENSEIVDSKNAYRRLSIFDEVARLRIRSIYADLAKNTAFSGILYHDDAFFTDFEDVSDAALAYYQENGLVFSNPQELRSAENMAEWSHLKTQALIDFTNELTAEIKHYIPEIKTARNLYARVILEPQSEEWFAQNLTLFTDNYDYVAIMAMPFMERAKDAEEWLLELVRRAKTYRVDRKKLVFELQSMNWNTKKPIDTELIVEHMDLLLRKGMINFGYYPDDFINNHPKLEIIKKGISTQTYPFVRK